MNHNIRKWAPNTVYLYFFIIFILGFLVYLSFLNSYGIYNNQWVYLTNSIVVIYSLLNLIANQNQSYSAHKIFFIFIFFFMGIAPIMQYKLGIETVGGYKIIENFYIITNLIVLGCSIIFNLSYNFFFNKIKRIKNFSIKYQIGYNKKDNKKYNRLLLFISIISTLTTIYVYKNQPILLIFRGVDGVELQDNSIASNQFLGPLFNCIIRPIPIICLINYLCIGKFKRVKYTLFLLAIISCFPSSLSRLRVAAYYLPIVIILFPKLRYHNRFVNLFIGGFLLIFPLFSNFRNIGKEDFNWIDLDYSMFCNINYDSYQSLAFVLQNDIITYGKQLAVVLFFWIPRSIWPDKPYFSGMMVADKYNLWFNQISMNYFAEGYINFGIIGIVLFTIFLGYISARFDKYYWIFNKANVHSLYSPFFLLFIGMYFFFMRGDLMYGFEYTSCLLITNWIIYKITKNIYKNICE